MWVINETFHQIYVFSNDGKRLLKTLGEKNVPGADATHFAKPQDVAFLPDGRILIADGLDNHRVMIFDRDINYLGEFGGSGKGPGQFSGVHAVAVGPEGRIFALDRSGGRINVFKTTPIRRIDSSILARLLCRSISSMTIGCDDRLGHRFVAELQGGRSGHGLCRLTADGYLKVHLLGGLDRQPLRRPISAAAPSSCRKGADRVDPRALESALSGPIGAVGLGSRSWLSDRRALNARLRTRIDRNDRGDGRRRCSSSACKAQMEAR